MTESPEWPAVGPVQLTQGLWQHQPAVSFRWDSVHGTLGSSVTDWQSCYYYNERNAMVDNKDKVQAGRISGGGGHRQGSTVYGVRT